MHSERNCLQFGWLNGKTQKMLQKNTIQRTAIINHAFGTDKSVPYAHAGRRPIQLPEKLEFGGLLMKTDMHNILYESEKTSKKQNICPYFVLVCMI